jgi:hypothetical protein
MGTLEKVVFLLELTLTRGRKDPFFWSNQQTYTYK